MEYTIKNERLALTVSSLGGEPKRIISSSNTDYLYRGNKDYWPGSAPHLFPFIGRLFENKYTYNGIVYPLSIHGFLKDSEMSLETQTDNTLVFSLSANEATKACYPFQFKLKIGYLLEDNRVTIGYTVINEDEKVLPFAIGGHPGFIVPLEDNLIFEDYYLEFSCECSPKRAMPTTSNLLTGEYIDYPLTDGRILPLNHDLFDQDAIILGDVAPAVTLKSNKGKKAVKVEYDGFNFLGIWHTVKSDAPFVCIEPWTALQGYVDKVVDIENHDDIMLLAKDEVFTGEIVITII